MESKSAQPTFERRKPEDSILYKIVAENVETFLDMASAQDDKSSLPYFVRKEFEDFLACGQLSEGFVRLQCDGCGAGHLVAFSCKKRGFCPSCAGRRMNERAFHLGDHVIPWVPTRQWVLSLPFQLRFWVANDDVLLKKVSKILVDEINNYLRKKARKMGVIGGETGIVSFLQRSGNSINPILTRSN